MGLKTRGMNRHQKAAHKVGERILGRDEIPELLELSESEDAEDRKFAAELLCPCHVRQRLEPVWAALYRLLEDPDAGVRRAAWHTLEDGGRPDDPVLDAILGRVLAAESDRNVRLAAERIAGPRRHKEKLDAILAARARPLPKGHCDFCGRDRIPVETDYLTTIPSSRGSRLALICVDCTASSN